MTDNPFVPGVRVAIESNAGFGTPTGYKQAFVDKVYKTGRFTLQGSTQQWLPHSPGGSTSYWSASQTGPRGYSGRDKLRIWDDANNAEICEAIQICTRCFRFRDLRAKIDAAQ